MKKLDLILALIAVFIFAISPVQANVNRESGNLTAAEQAVTLGIGNCGTATFQLSGTFTATITFEALTGNATWVAIPAVNVNTDARATTATAAGIYQISGAGFNQVRARVSAYTSGTVVVNSQCGEGSTFVAQPVSGTVTADTELPTAGALGDATANPTTSTIGSFLHGFNGTTWDRLKSDTTNGLDVDVTRVSGTVTVDLGANNDIQGDVAHDAADSGNPVKIGFKARTTNPTAVADADRVDGYADDLGKIVTSDQCPRDLQVHQHTTVSNTTETTILTAGAAGVFHDLKHILCTNTSATATEITIKDATAGTTRFVLSCPANDTRGIVFSTPLTQATAANNWTATAADAVTSLEITVQACKNN